MKNIKLLIVISILLFSSCTDWLDIKSQSEIDQEDLFSNAEGFRNAMNGVYLELASTHLYGKNLTWGFMSALEQYTKSDIDVFKKAGEYNYLFEDISNINDNIWEKSYNIILNCNNVINNIILLDTSLFSKGERYMIEGEARGIRSMLYLDLLRLYAPHISNGDNNTIPYYDEKTLIPNRVLKFTEITEKIINDLIIASELLESVDTREIMENEKVFTKAKFRFEEWANLDREFRHRGYHFNYYASIALLSRAYMYAGDKKQSYDYAKIIIDSELFPFSSQTDVSKELEERDVLIRQDIIFGCYSPKLSERYAKYTNDDIQENYLFLNNVGELFEDNVVDYRWKYLIKSSKTSDKYSLKYTSSTDADIQEDQRVIIPMLRKSELYYNVCEYLIEYDKVKALEYFNYLRLKRGIISSLPYDISNEDFVDELVKDARKEFLLEGQIFYMCKRLNHSLGAGSQIVQPENIEFTLPFPDVEININN